MSAPYSPALPPRGSPWASPAGWHASQTVLARRLARNGRRSDPIPVASPHLIRQPGAYAHVLGPSAEAIASVRPNEVRATVRNHLAGKIEQWFSQTEGRGVVFIVNATSTKAFPACGLT